MDRKSWVKMILVAACVGILAAGPSIMEGKPSKMALWSALVAMAGYVKGLFEERPVLS